MKQRKELDMPKTAKKATNKRANVQNLSKSKQELDGQEIRKVKGGFGVNWGDGTAKNVASITDGTSNTISVGEIKKK